MEDENYTILNKQANKGRNKICRSRSNILIVTSLMPSVHTQNPVGEWWDWSLKINRVARKLAERLNYRQKTSEKLLKAPCMDIFPSVVHCSSSSRPRESIHNIVCKTEVGITPRSSD